MDGYPFAIPVPLFFELLNESHRQVIFSCLPRIGNPVAVSIRRSMDYKLVLSVWVVFALSIIYWNTNRLNSKELLSDCHNAQIKMYYDKPMCTQCKLFCEVKK